MPIISRKYQHEHDFQAVMSYLRETYSETKSLNNWLPPRFENTIIEMKNSVQLWEENYSGEKRPRILAVVTPEINFRYFIQIHPDYCSLEEDILQWIEEYSVLQRAKQGGSQKLSVIALEGNSTRETSLRKRDFERGNVYGILRIRDLEAHIPNYQVPDGFKIRSVNPETDLEDLAKAIRVVFGHGESFIKRVLEETSHTSFYHKDLALVMVDREGALASFCTFRLDQPSGVAELEPMGTLPEYRGIGLAKALLCEGFRRLGEYNPKLLYIDGAANTPAANRLYEATGFTKRYNYYFWHKMI
jgi:ribosomal protein S18 acetylase RimI-like enzyme